MNFLSGEITEHAMSTPDLMKLLQTDMERGLTEDEADRRYARDGPNRLTPPPRPSQWRRLLAHMAGGFSLLLWAGSILCFVVYSIDGSPENLTLGIALFFVVSASGTFSWYQEFKSEKACLSKLFTSFHLFFRFWLDFSS